MSPGAWGSKGLSGCRGSEGKAGGARCERPARATSERSTHGSCSREQPDGRKGAELTPLTRAPDHVFSSWGCPAGTEERLESAVHGEITVWAGFAALGTGRKPAGRRRRAETRRRWLGPSFPVLSACTHTHSFHNKQQKRGTKTEPEPQCRPLPAPPGRQTLPVLTTPTLRGRALLCRKQRPEIRAGSLTEDRRELKGEIRHLQMVTPCCVSTHRAPSPRGRTPPAPRGPWWSPSPALLPTSTPGPSSLSSHSLVIPPVSELYVAGTSLHVLRFCKPSYFTTPNIITRLLLPGRSQFPEARLL